jgi:hypothetical protein
MKADIVEPTFERDFYMRADIFKLDEEDIPRDDTIDLDSLLDEIKSNVSPFPREAFFNVALLIWID